MEEHPDIKQAEKVETKPQLPSRTKRIRLMLLGGGLLVAAILFKMGIDYFCPVNNLDHHATHNPYLLQTMIARPGDIVDRKGRLLATSVSAQSLYLVPAYIESPQQTAEKLATLFDIDSVWVATAIEKTNKNRYLWLRHQLTRNDVQRINTLGLPAQSYGFQKSYLRCYPRGSLAAHILGTRNISDIGEGGVEEDFEHLILGINGQRLVLRDNHKKRSTEQSQVLIPPEDGKTIILTLDTEIQLFVEQELQKVMTQWKAKECCAIVMDPKSGDILASASFPNFDPNKSVAISAEAWENKTTSMVIEPEKMLHPFVIAWGLEKNVIKTEELLSCRNNSYTGDNSSSKFNVAEILSKDNDDGMQQILKRIQRQRLIDGLSRFGFSEVPDEPSTEHHLSTSTTAASRLPVMTSTPLQLITANAILANQGKLVEPHTFLRKVDAIKYLRNEMASPADEKPLNNQAGVELNIISEANADWLLNLPLVDIVNHGSGNRARLHDYAVFGYAGTSRKHSSSGNKATEKVVCSFICGAPADDPQLLVLVVIDQPSGQNHLTGATIAAPVASAILHKTLQYQQVPTYRSKAQAARKKNIR